MLRLNTRLLERFSDQDESWPRAVFRVADSLGRHPGARRDLRQALEAGKFIPAGQIWRGAGRPGRVLFNCAVTRADEFESVSSIATRITEWTFRGSGVGVDVTKWIEARDPATALTEIVDAIA